MTGQKFDSEKIRWDLVQTLTLEEYAKVLTFGARRYAPHGWREVEDAKERYFAALMRHIWAWRLGEEIDGDSGLHHLAHAMCCLAFLTEPELEEFVKVDSVVGKANSIAEDPHALDPMKA